MITIRRSEERGHAHHGWLDSWHTFSFAGYHDPRYMGYGPLRVINDDRIAPGTGFGMHGHRDMEIITYVLDGALEHKDSLGNGSVIRAGDVQRMSAGRGVMHSEFNPSDSEPVHLLQIWIEPDRLGVTPSYEDRHFDPASKRGRFRLIASPDGFDGSVTIHQNARVHASLVDGDERAAHELAPGRSAYVHLARGRATINGHALSVGDALQARELPRIVVEHGEQAELLLFDLAA
jgi:redox-sensitive bicupin YhaK (pirin superfamily)